MCRVNSYKANYRYSTVQLQDKHNIKSRVNYRSTVMQKTNEDDWEDNYKHRTLGL
jgi:hypothetical protein